MSIMRTHSKGPCALGILPLWAGLSLQILDSLSAFMRLEGQHMSGQEPSERTSGSEAFLRSQRLGFHTVSGLPETRARSNRLGPTPA